MFKRFFQPARRFRPVVANRTLRLESLEARDVPAADLGVASSFNVFALHDFTSSYSDTEGRLAAGGNVAITGYGLGTDVSNSHGLRDDLIVGGNLNFDNGQVYNGNVVVGGTATVSQNGNVLNGTVKQGSPIDFAKAGTELKGLSASWATLAATGTYENFYGTVTLTGKSATQNVFNLSAWDLQSANGLKINAPAGSKVLINVSGEYGQLSNYAMWLEGVKREDVVFNFYQAKTLVISSIAVEGNVVATGATVYFNNGQFNGTLVADSVCGNGQFNWERDVPVPPAPPVCPPVVPPVVPPVCPPVVPPVCPPTAETPPAPVVCPPTAETPPAPVVCPPTAETPAATSCVSGSVVSVTTSGVVAPSAGMTVYLTGITDDGEYATYVATTDVNGWYQFENVKAGRYESTIAVAPVSRFAYVEAGTAGGIVSGGLIEQIFIRPETKSATGYLFVYTAI